MHVVIFSGGTFSPSHLAQKAIKTADLILAADSGARSAVQEKIYPQAVIGDFDSLDEKTKFLLERKNIRFISYPREKNETDTQLAIEYATKQKATKITLLGSLEGNRFDHIIANLLLPNLYKIPIQFVSNNQIIWIEKGPKKVELNGEKNNLLSLIPIGSAIKNITTQGLYYVLQNGTLGFGQPRGISNVFSGKKASVDFGKGILLFVHTMVQFPHAD